MKNKKELIFTTLEKMGFSPEYDDDGDIVVLYQLKHIFIMTNNEDEPYASVLLPLFNEFEEDQIALVLTVCNKMTRDLKMAKVYIDNNFEGVSASCEFYFANKSSLEQSLRHSLEILGVIRTLYRNNLEEMSKD